MEDSLYSRSAEIAILGCILLSDGKLFPSVAADLTADDFYLQSHRVLFRVMAELDASGSPIDIVTLGQRVMSTCGIEAIGGLSYISSLTDGLPKLSNISWYIEIVKHKREFREIAAVTQQTSARLTEGHDTPQELAALVAHRMGEIVTASKRGGFVTVAEALRQSYDSIEHIGMSRHGSGLATGLRALDGLIGGLRKSEMIVIAGRPSLGKTALAVTIGKNVAKEDKSVALFSLEMGRDAIVQRMLCDEARVNSFKLSQGCTSHEDRRALIEASVRLARLQFSIDDEIQRIETMAARAKALQQQSGLDLLIVDYMQLIIGGRHESRTQEVSYISRCIKQLAKSLEIPVIAVAQLSRSPEERVDGEPKLSDLRDSGQIEQDSDVVMFLWKEPKSKAHISREEFAPEDNTVNLSVKKQRNGPTGLVKLAFLKEFCRFENRQ